MADTVPPTDCNVRHILCFYPHRVFTCFQTATSTVLWLWLNSLSTERYEINVRTEMTRVFANSVTNPRYLGLHIRRTSITCWYLPYRENGALVQTLATCPFLIDCRSMWSRSNEQTLFLSLSHVDFSVDKKNQLDVTFCILYFSSNSCSKCFGQPCAHHQELTTAWCYSLVLVCAVVAGRLSRPVGR